MKSIYLFGVIVLCIVSTAVARGDDVAPRFEERAFTYTGGPFENHTFKYRLLAPSKLEAGKRYPLVLFLHGAGERGDDNVSQLKYLPAWLSEKEAREEYPCYMLVPQCPADQRWGSIDWRDNGVHYEPQMPHMMQVVMGMLKEVMAAEAIDPDRVYLTGLSMGGYGTWELASREPKLFAAVAPVCGGGDVEQIQPLVDLPLWAWHGNADQVVSPEQSRRMIEALRDAGGEPKYSELAGVGHDVWTFAYRNEGNLIPWMFAQKRKEAPPETDP